MMTLDIPAGWQTLFEQANTADEWDKILPVASRCSKSVYAAAKEACNGRDTLSLKAEAYRQRCRDDFDGF